MKRVLIIISAMALFSSTTVFAQGPINKILNRFTDEEKGKTVFVEKGHFAIGIRGGFRSFKVGGEDALSGDGYEILSLLNIGDGKLYMYSVSPVFSYFLADDLSLGVRFEYSGYQLDTDLNLDLRNLYEKFPNVQLASRHMVSNTWGASIPLRKYLSFFGSKTFAIFGEARLYGNYCRVLSCPIVDVMEDSGKKDENGEPIMVNTGKTTLAKDQQRVSDGFSVGLKLAAGACVKLRDNSAITISVPLVGAGYNYTKQHNTETGNNAKISNFNISREIDLLAIQIGYTHYIKSKKKN